MFKAIADRVARRLSPAGKVKVEERGTLLASGLIAGEAIVGILLAMVFLAGVPALAQFGLYAAWGGWLSLLGFASIAIS